MTGFPQCLCFAARRSSEAFISFCLFVPSVLHWLPLWSSCPGSWQGLWGRWGCWWGRRGTGQSETPAEPVWALGNPGAGVVLAWAPGGAPSGGASSTRRCGSTCRKPARPSACPRPAGWGPGGSAGSEHAKAAAEPGRNTHTHFSWSALSAKEEIGPTLDT